MNVLSYVYAGIFALMGWVAFEHLTTPQESYRKCQGTGIYMPADMCRKEQKQRAMERQPGYWEGYNAAK